MALWALALLAALALDAANLYLGDLNQDEGWYLYAARQVSRGQVPYRDFAFTQGPALPYVYALAEPLVARFGLAGGRAFTALLGLAAALCAAGLAWRLVAPGEGRRAGAALIAFVLIGVNVYQSYFTTVVKTYSLSALFLALGFLLLTFVTGRRARAAAFGAGAAMALSAGTRLSCGAVLPVTGLFLLWHWRRAGAAWLWFGLGGGFVLAAMFLPLYAASPDGFLFGLIGYHTQRHAQEGLARMLALKAGALSRLTQAYFVAAAAGAAVVVARVFRVGAGGEARSESLRLSLAVWAGAAAVAIVHFSAPFPYDDYQVMVFPLAAAALAAAVVRAAPGGRALNAAVAAVFVCCAAASCSSPINQEWVVLGRDRIWWKMKPEPAIRTLQRAAALVRQAAGTARGPLLTQDTYLAVEAGMDVPPGLELGPFSYYPDWSDAQAARLHVMNRRRLRECIERAAAPVAALSGYSLSIRSPEVIELPRTDAEDLWRRVREKYAPAGEIENFGQAFTTLRILRRAAAAAPGLVRGPVEHE